MSNDTSNVSKTLLATASTIVVIAGLKLAESILVPFLLSIFIALIVSPFMGWLKKYRVPNIVSIILIIGIIFLVSFLWGALLGSSIADFRENLPAYQQKLNGIFAGSMEMLSRRGINVDKQLLLEHFNPGTVMQFVGNTLGSMGTIMTNAFLILLTVAFILAEQANFADKLISARPGSEQTLATLRRFASGVHHYLGIKSIMSLLTGFLIWIWLLILDIDYPFMWAVLAFALNYVPTIGSIIAAVPAVLLALVQFDLTASALTGLGYLVVNTVVGNILEPRWMGKGLNLSPLVVFLSLVFWGWVLGPVGMLLSIPLTMMLKIALESDKQTRWIGLMMGGSAP